MSRASFTGEHPLKIDAKGRMSIPAPFRSVLVQNDPDYREGMSPALYLLYGPHLKDHLQAYSVAAFDRITADIEALPPGSPERKRATSLILNRSVRLEVDKDGRIILPQRQREQMGMTGGDLMLAGGGDHFDIWPADTYAAQDEDLSAWLENQDEDFDPLMLLGGGGG